MRGRHRTGLLDSLREEAEMLVPICGFLAADCHGHDGIWHVDTGLMESNLLAHAGTKFGEEIMDVGERMGEQVHYPE